MNEITTKTRNARPPSPLRLAFAGGGTGGHLLPGISVAQAARSLAPGSRSLFLGTGRPAETSLFCRYPFPHRAIGVGVPRRTPKGALRFGRELVAALKRADRILSRFRPHAVVGLGGYASVPGVLGAKRMGIPVYLMEQNARIGLATTLLAPLARAVFCGFPSASKALGTRGLPSGNPLRSDLREHIPSSVRPGSRETRTLLVMGGSQGARGINALMKAAAGILSRIRGIEVIHLAGKDAGDVSDAYTRAGLAGARVAAFDPDVGRLLRSADLVISRAGAMAVSEIAAFARPALFIPYPHAGGHQEDNARPLVKCGGAVVRREGRVTDAEFSDLVRGLLTDPDRLRAMAEGSRAFAFRDAHRTVFARLQGDLAENPPAA
ncbi:MAG: UDP-N-acetylglucosamine--N-acetylmuramyl-(pentapeptide) pyrophosphoryl-undecaprenol N-acetylglucosamine transferase [Planctomycetota bacterium]|jgi:UDP-N-acetylglucosamine--N-acetylmuramyl-(pentapeptide) pyrophosphoryl-undecaprenol N-acetylglucosamine transferase